MHVTFYRKAWALHELELFKYAGHFTTLPGREELGSSIVLRRRERNPGLSSTTVGTLCPNNNFLEVDPST